MESLEGLEPGRSEPTSARKDFLRLSGAAGLAALGFGSGLVTASIGSTHSVAVAKTEPLADADEVTPSSTAATLRPRSDDGDDADAIRAQASALAAEGGGNLSLGAGKFSIRSPLVLPASVGLSGASSSATVLVVDNRLGGDVLSLTSASNVTDIGFTSATGPRRSGAFIRVNGNECQIARCTFTDYHVAVAVGHSERSAVSFYITDSYLRMPSTAPTAGAIDLIRFNSARVTGCVIVGPGRSFRQPAFGIRVGRGDTLVISDSNVTAHGVALDVAPESGNNCTALQVVNSYFDSAGTSGSGNPLPSVRIAPKGRVFNTLFSNCWFGLADGEGCLIAPDPGGAVTGLSFSGCQFIGSQTSGLSVIGEPVSDWSVVGGSSSGNNGPAILARGGTSDFIISSHIAGGQTDGHAVVAGRGPNQVGVKIERGSDRFIVTGCKFTGNLLGGLINESHAANSSFGHNISTA